jgi:hypothetical protein
LRMDFTIMTFAKSVKTTCNESGFTLPFIMPVIAHSIAIK